MIERDGEGFYLLININLKENEYDISKKQISHVNGCR